ncbi:conserved Plasmodium protein, unknown function [Plasmodium gallinaceum]|uniref:Uncharacterized protein n=1 Tax=Plasmodium gallinaceum TaxID=5849 RepID=A0A1J1H1W7_PLAGA|nr:conserved Plasmodium protein, unknown function [Plasmodium gallinaceum]CRG97318.1 conserved Plasmodium protein, unknown function [Plasmodium gallinaceum]
MEKRGILSTDDENTKSTKESLKRNEKQIQFLVYVLKKYIKKDEELKNRAYYFFPSDDALDKILFNLCKFIPKDKNILEINKKLNIFDSDSLFECANSERDSWNNQNTMFDDISLDEHNNKKYKTSSNFNLKDRKTNKVCVEWQGFVNEANGYAAIKIIVPFVYQEYYTYANRLVYFLFQKTKCLEVEDFLSHHKFINKIVPLYMTCKNKLCVKLSHIDASNDLYF